MKTQIYVSYTYYGKSLNFRRTFELPFVPFFGMKLTFDDENEWEICLDNDNYCTTSIDYNLEKKQFEIYVRNVWRQPILDEVIDETIEKYSSWERIDNTNIGDLKELMAQQARRIK